jgi:RHS repeat-associated protein
MYNMSGVNFNGTTPIVGQNYAYDGANRLTAADYGYKYSGSWSQHTAFDEQNYIYDANGNIKSFQRNGKEPAGALMDSLTYHYYPGTNRLEYISDGITSGAFTVDLDNQSDGNYAYDDNGNTIKDVGGSIAFIQYDITNRPIKTYKTSPNGASGYPTEYYYDANGNLVQKYEGGTEYYIRGASGETEVNWISNQSTKPTYYVYGNGCIGQIKRNGSTLTRYYYLKDHLGSTKMTVDASANVVSYEDYYPFGMTMEGRSMVNVDPKWRFTGKEKSTTTGHYLFGARTYNPLIGRWDQVDPMSMLSPTPLKFS